MNTKIILSLGAVALAGGLAVTGVSAANAATSTATTTSSAVVAPAVTTPASTTSTAATTGSSEDLSSELTDLAHAKSLTPTQQQAVLAHADQLIAKEKARNSLSSAAVVEKLEYLKTQFEAAIK